MSSDRRYEHIEDSPRRYLEALRDRQPMLHMTSALLPGLLALLILPLWQGWTPQVGWGSVLSTPDGVAMLLTILFLTMLSMLGFRRYRRQLQARPVTGLQVSLEHWPEGSLDRNMLEFKSLQFLRRPARITGKAQWLRHLALNLSRYLELPASATNVEMFMHGSILAIVAGIWPLWVILHLTLPGWDSAAVLQPMLMLMWAMILQRQFLQAARLQQNCIWLMDWLEQRGQ